MPLTTPSVKIDAVKARGGSWVEVILHGESYSDAFKYSELLEKKRGLTFVHPFDDPDVIAGQGTIAQEIFQQYQRRLMPFFVAIGGGGLIAGIGIRQSCQPKNQSDWCSVSRLRCHETFARSQQAH